MRTLIQSRAAFHQARRVVIKLGTQVVLDGDGRPALSRLYGLMEAVAVLRKDGCEPLLVSSGAVGLGARQLGIRPGGLAEKQACAAAGQGELMALYQHGFEKLGLRAAQVLLTEDDFGDPIRHSNLRRTLETLLALGAVPVLNENDAVSTLELERLDPGGRSPVFSDNDHLSALVASQLGADLLVLLSDVEALHTRNPQLHADAVVIPEVPFESRLEVSAEGRSAQGRGGMASKIEAAQLAASMGVAVVLTSGLTPRIIERLLDGEALGTFFLPSPAAAEVGK